MFLPDVETRIGPRLKRATRLVACRRVAVHRWVQGERNQLGFARQARNIKPRAWSGKVDTGFPKRSRSSEDL